MMATPPQPNKDPRSHLLLLGVSNFALTLLRLCRLKRFAFCTFAWLAACCCCCCNTTYNSHSVATTAAAAAAYDVCVCTLSRRRRCPSRRSHTQEKDFKFQERRSRNNGSKRCFRLQKRSGGGAVITFFRRRPLRWQVISQAFSV